MSTARHIPYLSFHKDIIRELCRPQKDDLLILAKGLGMRRIICALLKTYDRKEDLILVVNATPADEAGIGDELGIMGVRSPGFRVLTHEMSVDKREELYKRGGLFSVTSKILVHDFLRKTVPAKLITGLVVLHAEKVAHGSQEEFAIRLYRRENQSGFCKAFSDEPEMFAHGLSPMKDMLVNLNMTSVMIWPRYNEKVKTVLASRQAEVVEMYQPMTDLMRQCQDAVTECMEAMLVELKRDHSLNLDLEDLNVRNAQFKSFDTMVRMKLKPVWHKVGAKTRIHVAALTELRNLHTWLLEYDSATFASYINTLHRQFFNAQKIVSGPGKHLHDWFNAKAAGMLVEASQNRVAKRKMVMDNSPEPEVTTADDSDPANGGVDIDDDNRRFEDDEAALREVAMGEDENDDEVMHVIATQSQVVSPTQADRATDGHEEGDEDVEDDEDDELREVGATPAPPVFEPVQFDMEEYLSAAVKKRLRKGYEAVLEEQPKWSLIAKVLKEIEDTIARVANSHADAPGTNTVLIMCASDRTCLQLRQYLTSMKKTDPPFGPQAGRKMMETLYLSNWQHEKNGESMGNGGRMRGPHGDEVKSKDDMLSAKRQREQDSGKYRGYYKNRGQPSYKRRRLRGGATMPARQANAQMALEQKEALMRAQSAFMGTDEVTTQGDDDETVSTNGSLAGTLRDTQLPPSDPNASTNPGFSAASGSSSSGSMPTIPADPNTALLASQGIVEIDDEEADRESSSFFERLYGENFNTPDYGLLPAEDTVIIRPYGGEDDDILLQELRPRFVVLYEPNLPFIRRLEVYKNCNPGLALRVYQMTYTNSFEEDRFLSTMQREAEAFKKLIDDRSSMVIPIYNNNPRAPMRDHVQRSKTTYSSRNAGGSEQAEEARILVDIREMGALLPSYIDDAGIKVIPLTLTVGDYILSPKMCVERKALPDLESSLANGRLHSQCEAMTAHYETCILLIEFEEDKYGLRTREDARRESAGKAVETDWRDTFYLQAKVALLALTFPRLRIIWSSSPLESVKILSDLKLNHDEPDERSAMLKGTTDSVTLRDSIENPAAVEMLRAMPGVNGHNLRLVMSKVESIRQLVGMKQKQLKAIVGDQNGEKLWKFIHTDYRADGGYEAPTENGSRVLAGTDDKE